MWLTRKLDNKFSDITEYVYQYHRGNWFGVVLLTSTVITLMIIYLCVLYSELLIGLTIFRYGIRIQRKHNTDLIGAEQKEWLNDIIGKGQWKSMDYDFTASPSRHDEIRFLRKKNALSFKMVWG